MWTLTYSVEGERRVEFIPDGLALLLKPLARTGRAYRDAVAEVLNINAQLVTLWRQQQRAQGSMPQNKRRAKKMAPRRKRKKRNGGRSRS